MANIIKSTSLETNRSQNSTNNLREIHDVNIFCKFVYKTDKLNEDKGIFYFFFYLPNNQNNFPGVDIEIEDISGNKEPIKIYGYQNEKFYTDSLSLIDFKLTINYLEKGIQKSFSKIFLYKNTLNFYDKNYFNYKFRENIIAPLYLKQYIKISNNYGEKEIQANFYLEDNHFNSSEALDTNDISINNTRFMDYENYGNFLEDKNIFDKINKKMKFNSIRMAYNSFDIFNNRLGDFAKPTTEILENISYFKLMEKFKKEVLNLKKLNIQPNINTNNQKFYRFQFLNPIYQMSGLIVDFYFKN